MKIKGKKVLVTGAGGFIATHLVEGLVEEGALVKAFVQYNSSGDLGDMETLSKNVADSIEIIRGDITDPFMMRRSVKGMDCVFHLAALIAIPYSYNSPQTYVDTNMRGTLNMLQASLDEGVEKVVHTSTSEVYGTAIYTPIDEKHPLQGQSPYSATKIGADALAESYFRSFELPVATIRPFNTFGPRQSARAVIPTIISQTLSSDRVKLGSLDPVRDLTYVSDTVRGFIKVAESEKSVGEVINIGRGSGVTIGELLKMILALIGKEVEVELDKERVRPEKSEVLRLICSNEKAKELLGWEPEYSLEEGLKETIDWIRNNLENYKHGIYNV